MLTLILEKGFFDDLNISRSTTKTWRRCHCPMNGGKLCKKLKTISNSKTIVYTGCLSNCAERNSKVSGTDI